MRYVIGLLIGAVLFGAVPARAKEIQPTAEWTGKVRDRSLQDVAPKSGVVTDQDVWQRLWKAWKPGGELPQVDFKRAIVLVGAVRGPNRVMLRPTLTDDGDLRFMVAGTRMAGPGFGYRLVRVDREGIKTVNGKRIGKIAEFRGTLTTGIMAIGGETTGIILQTKDGAWELDLQGNRDLLKLSEQLNGKQVVVKGTPTEKAGVEIATRRIIKVTELKAAAAKSDAAVTGTVVVPADLPSFERRALEVKLWQYDPFLADVSADLFAEMIVDDYCHRTGTATKTSFQLGKASLVQADRRYYLTVFVLEGGKRTHIGELDGKRGLCNVLHGKPNCVEMIVREVSR